MFASMYRDAVLCPAGFAHPHVATFFIYPPQPLERVVNRDFATCYTVGEGLLQLNQRRIGMFFDITIQRLKQRAMKTGWIMAAWQRSSSSVIAFFSQPSPECSDMNLEHRSNVRL